jgi:hypothetical protein
VSRREKALAKITVKRAELRQAQRQEINCVSRKDRGKAGRIRRRVVLCKQERQGVRLA